MTKYGDINTEMLIYSQIFRDITSEKFPFKELTPLTSQGTTIRTEWVFFFWSDCIFSRPVYQYWTFCVSRRRFPRVLTHVEHLIHLNDTLV